MPLLTVVLPPGSLLADALRALRLTEDEVDCDYGLIAVDPETGRFALRVSDDAAARLAETTVTVYADPRIRSSPRDEAPE